MIWQDAPDGTYGNLIWNQELVRRMFYRPSSKEIKNKFNAKKKAHPYILINRQDIEKIREKASKNKEFSRYVEGLRSKAVSMLREPLEDFSDPAWSHIFHARHTKERAELLGFFYLFDNDERFAERLLSEIMSLQDKDWVKMNYLVASEIAYSASLAYDWIYSYLDLTARKEIENMIWSKYLNPALECYEESNGIGPDFLNHLDTNSWWTRCSSNWNMVCNGSVICASLALAETNDTSFELTEYALKGLPYTILQYLPDGASEESVGYWKYAFSYFCKSMCALETSVGTEFGYFKQPIIKQTIDYPLAFTGPTGTFNFHDSGIDPVADIPELFYFAKALNVPQFAAIRKKQLEQSKVTPDVYDLIWHDDVRAGDTQLPCDNYFRNSETVSIRSSHADDALAIAFHTGYNLAIHSHLDMGSIIVDYLGERWIHDIGNEKITYSERGNSVNRWDLYRMRAEGHNTVVVNPTKEPDQKIDADCRIESYDFKDSVSLVSADLSAALNTDNATWQRSITLDKINSTLTIVDELYGEELHDVYWFVHTKAECAIADDAKKVFLSQNSKKILLELSEESNAFFYLTPAMPLPSSPVIDGQDNNDEYTKIAIHIKDRNNIMIKVVFKEA